VIQFSFERTQDNLKHQHSISKTVSTNKWIQKISGYNIVIHNSVIFLYTNNKLLEREIKKTIPFPNASKRIKYLGINLTKELKDVQLKTMTWMKEIEEATDKQTGKFLHTKGNFGRKLLQIIYLIRG